MHELSICQSLLSQVNNIARQHHAIQVDTIHLRVGPLSGVVPELLQTAFTVAKTDSLVKNAVLLIQSSPIQVRCRRCHVATEASINRLVCGVCGDWHTTLLSGDELQLERIEMEIPS
ncbi:MAG: hydrogenase maturation nickel metallochaperone HypA [Gammaproteobacteria bacterium]|nr:hydrogenase maturation nickel metallochaperone HypA [Gammaproteobacteria bacterium]MDH5800699.1 hydrogenase maturation nickel metallochaperone HypA [Gammaproteobacteria bacterium]